MALPIPSPYQAAGFLGEVSYLLVVKKNRLAQRTEYTVSETRQNFQMTTQDRTLENRIGGIEGNEKIGGRKPKNHTTRISCWNITSWNERD